MTPTIRIRVAVWLLLSSLAASAQPTSTVVLNGLAVLFEFKLACLQVTAPDCLTQSITLTNGETYRGITLLAVDMTTSTVQIDNCGHIENIRISNASKLTAATAANDFAGGNASTGMAVNRPGLIAGNGLDQSGDGVLAGEGMAAHVGVPASSPGATGSGGGDEAGSAGTHIYYWWMEEAKQIEQARLDTAQQVLTGELPPQPLTPLTPASTSARLIGPDSVFIEHGRGMAVRD
jgi:hypothetical protein